MMLVYAERHLVKRSHKMPEDSIEERETFFYMRFTLEESQQFGLERLKQVMRAESREHVVRRAVQEFAAHHGIEFTNIYPTRAFKEFLRTIGFHSSGNVSVLRERKDDLVITMPDPPTGEWKRLREVTAEKTNQDVIRSALQFVEEKYP